jgi:hypothetical protein
MLPDIQKYINDKLNHSSQMRNQSILEDDSAIVLISNDCPDGMEEGSEEESGFAEEQRLIAKAALTEGLEGWLNQAFAKSDQNPTDPGMTKAMLAMAKTLNRSSNCNSLTIQDQMHNFGKGGAAARKSKRGKVIKPNPPAISTRLAPGRGLAPLGRRHKDRSGETLLVQTPEGPVTVKSGNPPLYLSRRSHNFSDNVDKNQPGPRH